MKLDFIYHVGYLAFDREVRHLNYHTSTLGPLTETADAAHEKAEHMWLQAMRGKVELYQRRCPSGFEYHARAIRGA